jgi:hypothetical protein
VKGEGNSSELFKLLVPNSAGSTSHRTLEKYFTRLFDEWASSERTEAATSGAAGSWTELDKILTTIQQDKRNGLGRVDLNQKKNKKISRGSFSRPGEDEINAALEASMKGTAFHRAATAVRDQLEESDDGDDNHVTPKRKGDEAPPDPKNKKGRGAGKANTSSVKNSITSLSDVTLAKLKADADVAVRTHELEKRRLDLEERRMQDEREHRMAAKQTQDLIMNVLAQQSKMMEKFLEKLS